MGSNTKKPNRRKSIRKGLQNYTPGTHGSFLQEIPSLKCLAKLLLTPLEISQLWDRGDFTGQENKMTFFFLPSWSYLTVSSQVVLNI